MQTSLPLLLVWTSPDTYVFSPTQISTHIECARKWAWAKIAGIQSEAGKGALLGTNTHSVLEKYLGEGARPDFVTDNIAAKVASSGLHLLPEPKTPGMHLERHFRFKSSRTGFIYHGFKDVEITPGVPVPSLGFDGSAPIVLDHKTTKSINKYAKTTEDLQYDSQSCLYGLDSMARFDCESADLGWVYYQTEGALRASPTTTRLNAKHALRVFDQIERVAEEAANAFDKKLQPLELPPNPDACKSYGGCPYQHLCNLSPSQKIRSRMSNSVIANLRARVQGAESSTTSTTPPPAPGPTANGMGCAPEDVPAPTTIPAAFAGTPAPGQINPPEGQLAPPESKPALEPKSDEKPKRASTRKKAEKDPIGADAHAHTEKKPEPVDTLGDQAAQAAADKAVEKVEEPIPAAVIASSRIVEIVPAPSQGFTLFVDGIPTKGVSGPRPAAELIEKAQARMSIDGPQDKDGNRTCDYRLVDFGKGAPFLVQFVLEQVDGTFDIALDTRTPEGAILLEPLSAQAARIFRGFR